MARDGYDITKANFILLLCFAIQKAVFGSQRIACQNFTATSSSQYFMYPRTPYTKYKSNEHLCWRIKADSPHKVVKIEFQSFMLEMIKNCSHDSLTIFDGFDCTNSKDFIGRYCGHNEPDDIVSKGDTLYLEFRSDNYINYDGFKLEYFSGYKGDFKEQHEENDDKKYKKNSLTTIIVGAIIGSLVMITGTVVFICVCASSRRCACRSGSSGDRSDDEGNSRRTLHVGLSRTDRVRPGDVPTLPRVENTIPVFPCDLLPPSYSEPCPPPPYHGFDAITLQRLPSSSPPPYTPNDPNPLFASLGDINMPHVPGYTTSRF